MNLFKSIKSNFCESANVDELLKIRDELFNDDTDRLMLHTKNKKSGTLGNASFLTNGEDKIKVFEGRGDGSDDKVMDFDTFVTNYDYVLSDESSKPFNEADVVGFNGMYSVNCKNLAKCCRDLSDLKYYHTGYDEKVKRYVDDIYDALFSDYNSGILTDNGMLSCSSREEAEKYLDKYKVFNALDMLAKTNDYELSSRKDIDAEQIKELLMKELNKFNSLVESDSVDLHDFARGSSAVDFIADGRFTYGEKIRFIADQLEESGNIDSYSDESHNDYLLNVARILNKAADEIDNLK
jgi:hypothetical protein